MTTTRVALRHTLAAVVVETQLPTTAELEWSNWEPMMLKFTLNAPAGLEHMVIHPQVSWHFARELLDAALTDPGVQYGYGNVRIEVMENTIAFDLLSAETGRRHVIYVEQERVTNLMIRSYMVVPAAQESAALWNNVGALPC